MPMSVTTRYVVEQRGEADTYVVVDTDCAREERRRVVMTASGYNAKRVADVQCAHLNDTERRRHKQGGAKS